MMVVDSMVSVIIMKIKGIKGNFENVQYVYGIMRF